MKTKKEIEETLKHCQDIFGAALRWVLEPPTGYTEVAPDDVRVGDFVSCNGLLTEIKRVDAGRIVKCGETPCIYLSTLQTLGATFLRPTPEPEPEYVQLPEGTEPAEGMFVRFADGTYCELEGYHDTVRTVPTTVHSCVFGDYIKALGLPLYRRTAKEPITEAKEQFEGNVQGVDGITVVPVPKDRFPRGTRVVVTKVEGDGK